MNMLGKESSETTMKKSVWFKQRTKLIYLFKEETDPTKDVQIFDHILIYNSSQKFLSGGNICQIYFLSGITGFFSPHLELFKCHLIKMFSPVVLSEQPLAHCPRSNHEFLSQRLQHS